MKKMKFLLLLVLAAAAETPEEHCAAMKADYMKCKEDDAQCIWMERSAAGSMTCDATIAGMTINPVRSKYMAFSRGYYTNVLGVMGKRKYENAMGTTWGGTIVADLNALNDAANTILLGANTAPITAIGNCAGKTAKDDTCFFPDATITPVSGKCSDNTNKMEDACVSPLTWKTSLTVAAEMVAAAGGKTYFVHDIATIKSASDADANLSIMDFSIKADANTNEMFGMGTRNSDKVLRDAIDVALATVITDGTYNAKYLATFGTACGADPAASDFCLHDDSDANTATVWPVVGGRLEKIIAAGEMTFCTDTVQPFHDGNGVGFDADIARAIVAHIKAQYAPGGEPLEFKYVNLPWETLVNGFGECKAGTDTEAAGPSTTSTTTDTDAEEPGTPAASSPAASLAVGLAIVAPIIALL